MAAVRAHVRPSRRVCSEREGVEEVSAEGRGEEGGGEAGGGLEFVVLVELGEAGAEVEEGGEPGEDGAGCFEAGWAVGGDRERGWSGLHG